MTRLLPVGMASSGASLPVAIAWAWMIARDGCLLSRIGWSGASARPLERLALVVKQARNGLFGQVMVDLIGLGDIALPAGLRG